MGVATGAVKSINRSNSLPKLDVSGAAIQGGFEERDPPILLPNQSDDISHLAIDIGGWSVGLMLLLSYLSFEGYVLFCWVLLKFELHCGEE